MTTARDIDDITKIAKHIGVQLVISVHPDEWHRLAMDLNQRPEEHRVWPRRPPYFIWNGARIEPGQGLREYVYRADY